MAVSCNRLNSLTVQKINKTGRYADGNNLYLECSNQGTKAWIFRFMLNGKARVMGLGSFPLIALADARIKALECKKLLLDGIDPIEERKAKKRDMKIESANTITFDKCGGFYIEAHQIGWKNAKHIDQWRNTIKAYASPIFGNHPIHTIDTDLVMRVLEPLWRIKPETASRLRGRIEQILSWATTRGYRKGENPARWRGHLDTLLPKRSSVKQVEHFSALPVNDIGSFLASLREHEGVGPRALEFLVLCASRTGEVTGARWSEMDLDNAVWTIPAERMKANKEHRVPLSVRALEILKEVKNFSSSDYVFSGREENKPLSNTVFLMLLRRMKLDVTTHGFRSTFRDWAAERTNYPREIAEAALAHTLRDKVEAAYRRSDLFEKRKHMMNEWAKFCSQLSTSNNNVIGIRSISA